MVPDSQNMELGVHAESDIPDGRRQVRAGRTHRKVRLTSQSQAHIAKSGSHRKVRLTSHAVSGSEGVMRRGIR